MAEPICITSFTKAAGAVTQTVTGIRTRTGQSFTPTWWIFFWHGFIGSDGFQNASTWQGVGFDDGVNRRAINWMVIDNETVPWPGPSANGDMISRSFYDKARSICLLKRNSLGGSIDASGFVSGAGLGYFDFQWTASIAGWTGLVVTVLCGGGNSYAQVGSEAGNGATGNQTFTSGLTGTPSGVFLMGMPTGIGDNTQTIDQVSVCNLGVMNGYACQGSVALYYPGDSYPAPAYRRQRTNRCLTVLSGGGSHINGEAHAVSIGSGNFVLNWDTAFSGAVAYLALFGVDVSIFAVPEPLVSHTTVTGLGQTPSCVLMLSDGATASTAVENEAQWSLAATNGVDMRSTWSGVLHNAGPTKTAIYQSSTTGLICATPTATGATLKTSVEMITLQTDGILIDYAAVSGETIQFICVCLGTATYAPAAPCAPTIDDPPIYPPPPVLYEDPCDMADFRVHMKLETESVRYRWAVMPLRDTTAMGGYKAPRVLRIGPITRRASDVFSGAWSAQTADVSLADVDTDLRVISRTRLGLRNCAAEIYVTSKAWSQSGGAPRALFAGTVYKDTAAPNRVLNVSINDLMGTFYSVAASTEEKRIPQRVVTVRDFPNAPEESKGLGIPILGGTVGSYIATAAGLSGVGVVDGVYCGRVKMNGAAGIPGPGDLTAVVAALQASVDAGTCYQDWGPRIGYADALELQNLGTVPSTYAGLAAIIGGADLDALLLEEAVTGGTEFECVAIACHAISELKLTNASTPPNGPSIWINDECVDPSLLGTDYWAPQIPGDATWAAQFGADRFTDIIGTDGITRRYSLILFDPASAYGIAVAEGARVSIEAVGIEDAGDGTGAPLTNYWDLYYHVLNNFILQDYQTGAWLAPLQFFFSDGVTLIDRILLSSFTDAKDLTNLRVFTGYLGSFAIGSGGERTALREVIASFNRSGGCLLADNDYGQLQIRVLDYRRAQFLAGHRLLRDKVDILPGFYVDPQPEWQVNQLQYQYGYNYHAGKWDRGFGGGGAASPVNNVTSQARYGLIKKDIELPYVRDDATALAVATYYLGLLAFTPNLVYWTRRGPCGLEDDVLRAVPITHWNGYGSNGWTDHAVWILEKTVDPTTLTTSFVGLDIEDQLT